MIFCNQISKSPDNFMLQFFPFKPEEIPHKIVHLSNDQKYWFSV
jgi:hypothetical protein